MSSLFLLSRDTSWDVHQYSSLVCTYHVLSSQSHMSFFLCSANVLMWLVSCSYFLTLSGTRIHGSSCDWSFAGSKEAAAKIRVRLTPTKVTFKALLERERRMVEIRARAQEMAEMRRVAQVRVGVFTLIIAVESLAVCD